MNNNWVSYIVSYPDNFKWINFQLTNQISSYLTRIDQSDFFSYFDPFPDSLQAWSVGSSVVDKKVHLHWRFEITFCVEL